MPTLPKLSTMSQSKLPRRESILEGKSKALGVLGLPQSTNSVPDPAFSHTWSCFAAAGSGDVHFGSSLLSPNDILLPTPANELDCDYFNECFSTNGDSGTVCREAILSCLSVDGMANNTLDVDSYQDCNIPKDISTLHVLENQETEEIPDSYTPQETHHKLKRNSTYEKTTLNKVKARYTNKSSSHPSSSHQLRTNRADRKLLVAKGYRLSNSGNASRTGHNLAEKQYRTRLNGQFDALLSALPDDVVAAHESNSERKLSKAAVIQIATDHISQLEKKILQLHRDRDTLWTKVEFLRANINPSGNDISIF